MSHCHFVFLWCVHCLPSSIWQFCHSFLFSFFSHARRASINFFCPFSFFWIWSNQQNHIIMAAIILKVAYTTISWCSQLQIILKWFLNILAQFYTVTILLCTNTKLRFVLFLPFGNVSLLSWIFCFSSQIFWHFQNIFCLCVGYQKTRTSFLLVVESWTYKKVHHHHQHHQHHLHC